MRNDENIVSGLLLFFAQATEVRPTVCGVPGVSSSLIDALTYHPIQLYRNGVDLFP